MSLRLLWCHELDGFTRSPCVASGPNPEQPDLPEWPLAFHPLSPLPAVRPAWISSSWGFGNVSNLTKKIEQTRLGGPSRPAPPSRPELLRSHSCSTKQEAAATVQLPLFPKVKSQNPPPPSCRGRRSGQAQRSPAACSVCSRCSRFSVFPQQGTLWVCGRATCCDTVQ